MGTVIIFITGALFTLIVFLGGFFFGYLVMSRRLEKKIEEIKDKFTLEPKTSGPVKAIKPEEIEAERKKGFLSRMEEIIS